MVPSRPDPVISNQRADVDGDLENARLHSHGKKSAGKYSYVYGNSSEAVNTQVQGGRTGPGVTGFL